MPNQQQRHLLPRTVTCEGVYSQSVNKRLHIHGPANQFPGKQNGWGSTHNSNKLKKKTGYRPCSLLDIGAPRTCNVTDIAESYFISSMTYSVRYRLL